jgi:hypothetical protein
MHSLAHLFGANHEKENSEDAYCKGKENYLFLNTELLDDIHQLNIGLRPNSLKVSPCAKQDIAAFLGSSNPTCLKTEKRSHFCGDGNNKLAF